ncbi:uncharacterized protein LOC128134224 [Lactuca sativa]|uniref:uncharacterized protein LOC128134224 n=1 Tax=Lactuca sativa TaxID=4236 RepID=UPI0022AF1545|nr:uncharacterized protein LOC128134224 [Lactuca sativa]
MDQVQAPINVQPIGQSATSNDVAEQQNRLKKNEKRCMRELRGALPPMLKTHESEVAEMVEESKQSLGGPLALVSKISEIDNGEMEGSDNEGKPNDAKSGFTKAGGEEKKKLEKVEEKQKDAKEMKKLKGDSGIYCHYCNGANHFAADCMLRKKEEKKSKIKDEAYYSEKLEEVRAKAKGMSLVANGESNEEESGTNQIWDNLEKEVRLLLAQRNIYCNFAKLKDENDKSSTSQHGDFDNVEVESWKTDDTDEDKEVKDSHTTPQRVVVDQVFDNTIFPNQVFVTTGNVEKIKPEFNKIVENDNQRSTTKASPQFMHQNIVERKKNEGSSTELPPPSNPRRSSQPPPAPPVSAAAPPL